MNSYIYDEQLLKKLVKEEEPYYSVYNVGAEQRLKEHLDIRNKYNPQFKEFAEQTEIKVQEILPFHGASNRWIFSKGKASISVYFDIHRVLGFHSKPYFEIFPDRDGDAVRFTEEESSEFLVKIHSLLT